jgi:hypothetical protein
MSKVYIAEYAGLAQNGQGDGVSIFAAPPPVEQRLDTATTTGLINVLGAITAGSGYTNGSYLNVPLTGGTGNGATANITVAGGAVTAVTLVNRGQGYTAADSLSASTAIIGAGTLFAIPVTSISVVSAPFNAGTRFVEISVDGIVSLQFNTIPAYANGTAAPINPVATTPVVSVSNQRLSANEVRRFGVQPGSSVQIITNT